MLAGLSAPLANTANQLRFIGNTAYTTSYTSPSGLYTINLATGAGALVGSTGLDSNNGLGEVVAGKLVDSNSGTAGSRLYFIDPATGVATPGPALNQGYVF